MALIVIIGSGLGWIAYHARAQRDAVAVIIQAGGAVYYDDQAVHRSSGVSVSPSPGWSATAWLREWVMKYLGDEYWRTVVRAELGGVDLGDAEMAHISVLAGLEILDLSRTKVTDVGLAKLEGLMRLTTLCPRGHAYR